VSLTKVYHGDGNDVWALRCVNLELYEGETMVLLGPSGSSKSTFLNILGGLDRPSSGQAFFRRQELTTLDDNALS
jgi:putative ABC transport system ATP-binding protein|tara:strand:- start:474 stop:698 length:225 start_codon:yes stop_codon:yes gene_type:complete